MKLFKRKKKEPEDFRPVYYFKHILYMESGFAVCHRPQDLGTDFVKVDTRSPGKQCPFCLPLVVAHNARDAEEDARKRRPRSTP